jgi:hypothetical protein
MGFLEESFLQKEREKPAAFPRCLLSEFVSVLLYTVYIPPQAAHFQGCCAAVVRCKNRIRRRWPAGLRRYCRNLCISYERILYGTKRSYLPYRKSAVKANLGRSAGSSWRPGCLRAVLSGSFNCARSLSASTSALLTPGSNSESSSARRRVFRCRVRISRSVANAVSLPTPGSYTRQT